MTTVTDGKISKIFCHINCKCCQNKVKKRVERADYNPLRATDTDYCIRRFLSETTEYTTEHAHNSDAAA